MGSDEDMWLWEQNSGLYDCKKILEDIGVCVDNYSFKDKNLK